MFHFYTVSNFILLFMDIWRKHCFINNFEQWYYLFSVKSNYASSTNQNIKYQNVVSLLQFFLDEINPVSSSVISNCVIFINYYYYCLYSFCITRYILFPVFLTVNQLTLL